MTALYFGKTRSGWPGRLLACSRKRKPLRNSSRRTRSSGLVFFPRIPAIIRDRTAGETTSANSRDDTLFGRLVGKAELAGLIRSLDDIAAHHPE